MSRPGWRPPPWFVTFAPRLRFVGEAQLAVATPVRVVKPSRRCRGGFAVAFVLTPDGLEPRQVRIEFAPSNPEVPRVFVDGPIDSPHRYEDGSLCMWFPKDPVELRWRRADGAAELLGCIALHLLREQWWRETGEWVGPEAPHAVRSHHAQRRAAA